MAYKVKKVKPFTWVEQTERYFVNGERLKDVGISSDHPVLVTINMQVQNAQEGRQYICLYCKSI